MQTMLLSKALTNRGALFKQQIYPDEGHNLGGVKQHLYRSMTLFFEECFKKQVRKNFFLLPFAIFTLSLEVEKIFILKSWIIWARLNRIPQVPMEVKAGLGNGGANVEQSN